MSNLVKFLTANPEPVDKNGDEYSDWYDDFQWELKKEFPGCPFEISLPVEQLLKLDNPFMDIDEFSVWVKDTRGSYYNIDTDLDTEIRVSKVYKFPGRNDFLEVVTLKMVLTAMSTEPNYRKFQKSGDGHIHLECFKQLENCNIWSPVFGS